jgi:hypothetical protein
MSGPIIIWCTRNIRDAFTDPFHFRGLAVERKAFVQAFDLFRDPLVKQFLDRKPYENEAKQQLGIIKEIENHATATPWNRVERSVEDAQGRKRRQCA